MNAFGRYRGHQATIAPVGLSKLKITKFGRQFVPFPGAVNLLLFYFIKAICIIVSP